MQGTAFEERVRSVLVALRPGEVVTYGEVAEEAGHPGAARAVGNLLAGSEGLPWWRVVTASGRLVPGHEREQARRLRAEGIPVDHETECVRPGGVRSGTWPRATRAVGKGATGSPGRARRSGSTGS